MTEAPEATSLLDRLIGRLNVPATESSEVERSLASAHALVAQYAAPATPKDVQDTATLEVAAELWARRDAKGGIIAAFQDGPVTRLARDPMVAAYPLLDPWKGLTFG